MRQNPERHQDAAERTVKDIRRQTRKRYSSEEEIRIVLAGLSGDGGDDLCIKPKADPTLVHRFKFGVQLKGYQRS